ncbi:MAG: bifunctional glycosyltransferase family 2/GtrA family protein [Kiritimatiellae bacterium]|nr:bifunctional glycosyltransferase family 2/GtrA family protein [Kiritimatiellia bacterium]
MNAAIVIPSLDPDERLPGYCRELRAATDAPIVLVDDGSRADLRAVFDECVRSAPGVELLRHDVNRGKGRALKTAFSHLLAARPGLAGCVTADADGQHAVADVVECLRRLEAAPEALVLGCRRFTGPDVPWKSSFGNNWMRLLFRLATGRRFLDTQTGLRGIPASFMRELLAVPGDRFEFESDMLLRLGKRPLDQYEIRTIYENGNRGTHFRPVEDSLSILRLVLRGSAGRLRRFALFAAVSLASFAVDIGLFHALHEHAFPEGLAARLFLSVALARAVSLCFNYACNRRFVFRDGARHPVFEGRSLGRYLLLAAGIMTASWALTKAVSAAMPGTLVTPVKACVDLALFLASYAAQRSFVFR